MPRGDALLFSLKVLYDGRLRCALSYRRMLTACNAGANVEFVPVSISKCFYGASMIIYRLQPDEYIIGTVAICFDLIHLFLYILQIFSESSRC